MNELKPALFLDRDGIVNVDKGYVYKWEDVEFCPGIVELIRTADRKDYLVFVVSNQSGVARGYYSKEDVDELHRRMGLELEGLGAYVKRWYYCPDLENPEMRKPAPGMILKAEAEFPIDRNRSLMVGDKPSDVINLEGLKCVLVRRNYDLSGVDVPIFESLEEVEKLL